MCASKANTHTLSPCTSAPFQCHFFIMYSTACAFLCNVFMVCVNMCMCENSFKYIKTPIPVFICAGVNDT